MNSLIAIALNYVMLLNVNRLQQMLHQACFFEKNME